MSCVVYHLGLTGYEEARLIQERLLDLRWKEEIEDTLLLLEHPPTITIGRFGNYENILSSRERLKERGICLFPANRGGDITYHGPGQLVVYPIINLRRMGLGVRQYVHNLEGVIIRLLDGFSIPAGRCDHHAGVWVEGELLAAIGLGIKKGVSMHGAAININTILDNFLLIRPCGLPGKRVTSVSRLLGRHIPMENVISKLPVRFSEVFHIRMEIRPKSDLAEVLREHKAAGMV